MSHYKYVDPFNKRYVSITAIEKYSNVSFEEMRWEFYQETNATFKSGINEKIFPMSLKDVTSNIKKSDDDNIYIGDNSIKASKISQPNEIIGSNILLSMNKTVQKPKHKKVQLLKENEPIKRGYFSETDYSLTPKKMRCEYNSSDNESSNEEVINISSKRNLTCSDEIDLLSKSIGKKIKVNDVEENVFCKKRRERRKVVRSVASENATEEKRIVAHIDLLRKEGNTFVKNKDFDRAYQSYSTAISCSFNHPSLSSICYSNRALCLLKMGNMPGALEDCASAISLDNKNYKAFLRKIKCLIELSRYSDAHEEALLFNKTWKVDEGRELLNVVSLKLHFASLLNEGDNFFEKNSFSEALKNYNAAIDIDNSVPLLYKKRADVLFLMARYNESLTDLEEALTHVPDDDGSVRSKIECLVKLERFNEAVNTAFQLQSRSPSREHDGLVIWSQEMKRQADSRNFYQILGVTESASLSEIKKRYKRQCLLYHPDKLVACDPESTAIQAEKFKKLNQIYTTLSDPVSRRMYDIELRCHY